MKESWPTTAQVDQAIQSMSALADQLHALDSGIPSAEYDPTVMDLHLLKEFLDIYASKLDCHEQSITLKSIEQAINRLLKALEWPVDKPSPMRFVYQVSSPPRGRRSKRGKKLESIIIHVVDREEVVCGLSVQASVAWEDGKAKVTSPGVKLYRLSDDQVRAWLRSQRGSGAFSAEMCWECKEVMKARLKHRGDEGVDKFVVEVMGELSNGL